MHVIFAYKLIIVGSFAVVLILCIRYNCLIQNAIVVDESFFVGDQRFRRPGIDAVNIGLLEIDRRGRSGQNRN